MSWDWWRRFGGKIRVRVRSILGSTIIQRDDRCSLHLRAGRGAGSICIDAVAFTSAGKGTAFSNLSNLGGGICTL